MSDIGRHIVKFRKTKGLSQEALGEQLHVTRQTISSWENERTLPDIQMLSSIAKSLDVSIEQIIYGRDIKIEPRDVTLYKRTAVISALATVVCICAALLIRPHMGHTIDTYRIMPELLYMSVLCPLSYIWGAICFLSVVSLIADISLPNYRWRLSFAIIGAGTVLVFIYFVLVVYSVVPGGLWAHRCWFWIAHNPYIFLLPGVCLFFGLNRRS